MPPAPTGNKNAQLGQAPLESQVILRVTRKEKAAWVAAAQPHPLATWIRDGLNWLAQNPQAKPEESKIPRYKE
jgi:hypothetical protein